MFFMSLLQHWNKPCEHNITRDSNSQGLLHFHITPRNPLMWRNPIHIHYRLWTQINILRDKKHIILRCKDPLIWIGQSFRRKNRLPSLKQDVIKSWQKTRLVRLLVWSLGRRYRKRTSFWLLWWKDNPSKGGKRCWEANHWDEGMPDASTALYEKNHTGMPHVLRAADLVNFQEEAYRASFIGMIYSWFASSDMHGFKSMHFNGPEGNFVVPKPLDGNGHCWQCVSVRLTAN